MFLFGRAGEQDGDVEQVRRSFASASVWRSTTLRQGLIDCNGPT